MIGHTWDFMGLAIVQYTHGPSCWMLLCLTGVFFCIVPVRSAVALLGGLSFRALLYVRVVHNLLLVATLAGFLEEPHLAGSQKRLQVLRCGQSITDNRTE